MRTSRLVSELQLEQGQREAFASQDPLPALAPRHDHLARYLISKNKWAFEFPLPKAFLIFAGAIPVVNYLCKSLQAWHDLQTWKMLPYTTPAAGKVPGVGPLTAQVTGKTT